MFDWFEAVSPRRTKTFVKSSASIAALAAVTGVLTLSSAAHADGPYLVGFVLYRCTPDGTAINDPYFYTSNGNISAFRQTHTSGAGSSQSVGISFGLSLGDNTFSFTPSGFADPGSFAGVQLYFNSTGVPFQPVGPGIAPDLAAFVPTTSSAWSYVSAGAQVISYGDSYGPLVSYGGATSFTIGDSVITLSALNINNQPSGSMTLSVSTVPAPGVLSVLALAGIVARRRR